MIKYNLQFFGGRGSAGGNKVTAPAKTEAVQNSNSMVESNSASESEISYAEDLSKEKKAQLIRNFDRASLNSSREDIAKIIREAPIGTTLTTSDPTGSRTEFTRISEDSWEYSFKHDRGFEHLDRPSRTVSTSRVSSQVFETKQYENKLFDMTFKKIKRG